MTNSEFERTKYLLKKIRVIREEAQREAELKGEIFNIFQVLKLDTKEVKLHTPFLIELLSPKGSHSFGITFLSIFIDLVNEKLVKNELEINKNQNFEKARVKGKYIGRINEQYTEGGDIDILIESDDLLIVIENKTSINGNKDQKNQLLRYNNYLNGKGILIYLTLNGDAASKGSSGKLKMDKDYYCFSYREDIISWLRKCLKVAKKKPILHETIKQYIILIKKLTGQLTNEQMNKELINLLLNNYEESKLIKDNWNEILIGIRRQIMDNVKLNLVNNQNIERNCINICHESKRGWPSVSIKGKKWGDFIEVYMQSNLLMSSGFEIGIVKGIFDISIQELKNRLPNIKNIRSYKKNDWLLKPKVYDVNEDDFKNVDLIVSEISLRMKELYNDIDKDWTELIQK